MSSHAHASRRASAAATSASGQRQTGDLRGNAAVAAELGKPTPEEMQGYLGAQLLDHLTSGDLSFTTARVDLPPSWRRIGNQSHGFECVGRSASDAIDDIYDARGSLECNLAAQLAALAAVRDSLGKRKFDAQYKDKPLILSATNPASLEAMSGLNTVDQADLLPGDLGYVQNHWAYAVRHPAGGWGGENCAYAGEGNWIGFGVTGTFTEASLRPSLVREFNASPSPQDTAKWATRAEDAAKKYRMPIEQATSAITAHRTRAEVPTTIAEADVPGLDAGRQAAAQAAKVRDEVELDRALVTAAGRWTAAEEGQYGRATAQLDGMDQQAASMTPGGRTVRRLNAEQAIALGGKVR